MDDEADTVQLRSAEKVPTGNALDGEIAPTKTSSATDIHGLCHSTSTATTPSELKVCQFFLKGKCKFGARCHNFHPYSEPNPSKLRKSHSSTFADRCTKKPAMKTATNVLHRILWDSQLPSEMFVVGYLDRFVGVVELPFESFNGLDKPSHLSHKVLAIPKHRIQYFKYKDVIVWDKANQVDNVFGSRGTGKTIIDVMREVDGEAAGEVGKEEESEDECISIRKMHGEAVEREEERGIEADYKRDDLQVNWTLIPVPVA